MHGQVLRSSRTRRMVALVALCSSVLVAVPADATTFTARVDPPEPGTAAAPKPHAISFIIHDIKKGVDGNPSVSTTSLDETLPPSFKSAFDRYATCDKTAVKSDPAQPNCPASSVLGTLKSKAFVPSLLVSGSTDRGFAYKTGPDTFAGWVHVSSPAALGIAVTGALKMAADGSLTAAWDFSGVSNYGGLEVRVASFESDWAVAGSGAQPAPPAVHQTCLQKAAMLSSKEARTAARRGCQRQALKQACLRKASKIRSKYKRAAAKKRCTAKAGSRHATSHKGHVRADTPPQQTSGAFSPFESTGCPAGTWTMKVRLGYKDGTNEALESSVNCQTGAGTLTPPVIGGSPLCIPGIPPPLGCPSMTRSGGESAPQQRT